MKPRWLPNLDADAHNARVRSQRSEMRAQEAAHRVHSVKADAANEFCPADKAVQARAKADAASSRPFTPGADAATRKGAESRSLPRSFASAAGAPIYPLVGMCRAAGLPEPIPEYQFHHARKWRIDFAWPIHRIGIEIEGGIWSAGRHTRGSGYLADMEKYNAATMLGWRLLRYAPAQLGQAIDDLRIMLAGDAA